MWQLGEPVLLFPWLKPQVKQTNTCRAPWLRTMDHRACFPQIPSSVETPHSYDRRRAHPTAGLRSTLILIPDRVKQLWAGSTNASSTWGRVGGRHSEHSPPLSLALHCHSGQMSGCRLCRVKPSATRREERKEERRGYKFTKWFYSTRPLSALFTTPLFFALTMCFCPGPGSLVSDHTLSNKVKTSTLKSKGCYPHPPHPPPPPGKDHCKTGQKQHSSTTPGGLSYNNKNQMARLDARHCIWIT